MSEEEIVSLEKDISHILEYVGQVSAISPSSGEPEVALNHNTMRGDSEHETSSALFGKRDALLAALPKREGDYNVVRKIIQKDE